MTLDLSKRLSDICIDVIRVAKQNGYIVDVEFNIISLYDEHDSKLDVIKIVTGRDGLVQKIVKRVFDKTKSDPVEEYDMVGVDGKIPIWKKMGKQDS